MKSFINFVELFFVFAATMSMPLIAIGNYFSLIKSGNRNSLPSIFFLIITVLYASSYSYFSWKAMQENENYKKLSRK